MSTLKCDNLQNSAGTKTVPMNTVVDGSAKAWVNFNGTGTVAVRAAFNVSSITDNGVGDYTVNFATALVDANYSSSGHTSTTLSGMNCITETTKTTATFRFICGGLSAGTVVTTDPASVNVAVFR